MSFKTSLVDIDKITSKIPRSNFAEEDLEKLAQLILQLDGIVQPLVVEETSLERYELVEGSFQFYGALKAWEFDDEFETIRAFIVNKKENDLISQQLNLLHDNETKTVTTVAPKEAVETNKDKDSRIDNLENRFNQYIENYQQDFENKIKQLKAQIEQINKQLAVDNKQSLNEQLPTKLDLLTAFNTLEIEKLVSPLQIAGITNKELDKVVKFIREERKKKPFAVFS